MTESDDPVAPDFAPLFAGQRAVILECLQSHLTQRWVRSERVKGQIGDWKRMRHQGRAEFAALAAFLKAAGEANRADLARFVLQDQRGPLHRRHDPGVLDRRPAGERPAATGRPARHPAGGLAVPRQMEILEGWQQRALGVGYFDEDYQASQMWKADWEAADGDRVAARARATDRDARTAPRTGRRPAPPGSRSGPRREPRGQLRGERRWRS